jgi:hypothetical protein
MNDAAGLPRIAGTDVLRSLGIFTLAVATICATLPAPEALADSAQQILLAQIYQPPPAYPPTEPSPGYQPPPAYPPTEPPPPGYQPPAPGYPPQMLLREAALGMSDGRSDAVTNISGVLWFFAGCFLTWIGVLLGYLLAPNPDGARLIGKSSAYVQAYTDAYQTEGKSVQGIHAVYGCVTSGAIELVVLVLAFAFDAAIFSSGG